MRAQRITEHITGFSFKKLYSVRVWAVTADDGGYLLIDSAFEGMGAEITARLHAAGFSGPPEALVLTHAHLDHCGAAAELVRQWGVPVVASTVETPYIERRAALAGAAAGPLQKAFLGLAGRLGMVHGPPVDVVRQAADGDMVDGLKVVAIPGHTPGQIALMHEQDGAVISADAFINFRSRIGHDPLPWVDIDHKLRRESLAKLSELGCDIVLPSHGPPLMEGGCERIKQFLEQRA